MAKKKAMKAASKKVVRKDYNKLSIAAHAKHGGKLQIASKFKLVDREDLSIAYTPGVAAVSMELFKNKALAKKLTLKKNTIAVVSDGSAVLGLGNIGAEGAIPVMEGKAVLMKHFADVDAFPICINSEDVEVIIQTIKNIEPVFGGINLEDIAAPKCFEIEDRLRAELKIPVMHDDQWGAATVTIAALINALKVVKKNKKDISIALVGAGAAGIATARLIKEFGVKNLTVFDSKGALSLYRTDLNKMKKEVALMNKLNLEGTLEKNMEHFDVFIGLSKPGVLNKEMVARMKENPIVFALANPSPEIMPDEAILGGAKVVGTGRSDFPNQINNSVFFPGFWRGMLDRKQGGDYANIVFIKAAEAIAKMVKPTADKILPSTLDKAVHRLVAKTVSKYN